MPRVTILIPTHNHGSMLLGAVRSALKQTHQDFELLIIGDGVTPETRAAAEQAVALDPRIRFFDHPKSPRHGEPYRHQVLQETATGELVCYLSDDDLWMPDHLEVMCRTLAKMDIAHALPLTVNADGAISGTLIDFSLPEWVKWTLDGNGRTGISFVGHTMEFYRRLPHGWRSTPPGTPTDQYMWWQMLSMPGMRGACTGEYTVVCFPSILRKDWPLEQRIAEMHTWEKRVAAAAEGIIDEVQRALALSYYHYETGYHHLAAHIKNQDAELAQWEQRRKALPGFIRNLLRWYWKKKGL